jgi:P-type Cu+ transporter
VFFLLIGRLFQAKTYHALSFDRDYRSYLPVGVVRRTKTGEEVVSADSLMAGDEIIIRNQELIPVDGNLADGEGCIDYSFLTGESAPQIVRSGERVMAGGRQLGGAIAIAVTKEVSGSYLARLWRADCFNQPCESPIVAAANVAAKYFTIAVLMIAVATALFWWQVDSSMTLNAVTAVLMVACPCALAMASPYVFGTAMRLLGRNGIYLRSAQTVEQLAHTTHIVFDKTGTLTYAGSREQATPNIHLSEYHRTLVSSLARQSIHPVSRFIWQNFWISSPFPVNRFDEAPGKGTSGIVEGHTVRIGSYEWVSRHGASASVAANGVTGSHVWIAIDDEVMEAVPIAKGLRPGLKDVVSKLARKYKLSLLSGDDDSSRDEMADVFESSERLFFHQSPQEKLDYVQNLQRSKACVVMIGDGLNDAGALRQADIGITIVEDTSSFTPSSDAIVAATSFRKLSSMVNFSQRSLRVLYLCFVISLAYNIIGLGFAVAGLLTPLVAAVLMPLSSVSVISVAVLATRYQAMREGLA